MNESLREGMHVNAHTELVKRCPQLAGELEVVHVRRTQPWFINGVVRRQFVRLAKNGEEIPGVYSHDFDERSTHTFSIIRAAPQ